MSWQCYQFPGSYITEHWKMYFSYKSIFQDCGLFCYTKSEQWYQCCDFCCLKFKIEMIISCSPVIACHNNGISFEVTVLHNIEIGFFIQVPFSDCVLLTFTKGKNDTNAVFLLFGVVDVKEALYNYRWKDGIDMTWFWKYLYYKTLKMTFSYKSLFEIVSFSLIPTWKMTPILCFCCLRFKMGMKHYIITSSSMTWQCH